MFQPDIYNPGVSAKFAIYTHSHSRSRSHSHSHLPVIFLTGTMNYVYLAN